MHRKIVMLTGVAVVSVAVAAGAAASPARQTAPPPETASPGVELMWGDGGAPRYVARAAAPAAASARHGAWVELRWGTGGPPEYVTHTAP